MSTGDHAHCLPHFQCRENCLADAPAAELERLGIDVIEDGPVPDGGHGYQVHVGPMYADTRGTVKITSTDPRQHPALKFDYLPTENDRRDWVEAVRVARRILGRPPTTPGPGYGPTSRSWTGIPVGLPVRNP
ncbi:GMC oxidoreductase [Amycolatopsis sp. PS_44_ISF1]|uniref:GMC oxidoreductase n=1 Tax=Amycolatopsis sp. PS_44_ISF1 TaxID=2974917 RepID=UPI0037BEA89A